MITSGEWDKVRSALMNPKWDFISVDGIANEAGLNPRRVARLIDQHRSEVRQAISKDGIIVYTHGSRPVRLREIISKLQRIASKSF